MIPQDMTQDMTPDDSAHCVHEDAVKWNPYNKVVQCHRCGQVFTPGSAAAPADAVYAFAAWLTSRSERVGPCSRFDDAAPIGQLVSRFCGFQGWEVSPNYPHTFRMPPDGGLYPQVTQWGPDPEAASESAQHLTRLSRELHLHGIVMEPTGDDEHATVAPPAKGDTDAHLDAHDHEIDTHRERLDHMQDRLNQQGARLRHVEHEVSVVRDGLDAWAARIQRLEALPGVAEALAAQDSVAGSTPD